MFAMVSADFRRDSITSLRGKIIMFALLMTILIGFVVGAIAKAIMPGNDPGGFIITTALGVAGAVLGQYVGQAMGFYAVGEPAGFVMSVFGAFLLLALYRLFVGRRAHT